jgi:hypothetical protein
MGYSGRLGAKADTERTKNSFIAPQNTPVQIMAFEVSFPTKLAKNIFKIILLLSTKYVVGELIDVELLPNLCN